VRKTKWKKKGGFLFMVCLVKDEDNTTEEQPVNKWFAYCRRGILWASY